MHRDNPYAAYDRTQQSAMSIRQMEQAVMIRAIRELEQAARNVGDHKSYVAALTYHRKIWSAIQINMIEDTGRIAGSSKARLLELSLYVDRQTIKALSAPSSANLEPLIEINKTLAGGFFAPDNGPAGSRSGAAPESFHPLHPSGTIEILPPRHSRTG
ncbi:MAG: hypothetical protein HQ504_11725 [Rhodospirillaceae bacterium]|nr:hypothetical protein [Rhodospirillaceae bacterium]